MNWQIAAWAILALWVTTILILRAINRRKERARLQITKALVARLRELAAAHRVDTTAMEAVVKNSHDDADPLRGLAMIVMINGLHGLIAAYEHSANQAETLLVRGDPLPPQSNHREVMGDKLANDLVQVMKKP